MSTGQTVTTQLQLDDTGRSGDITVFSPPGITVETAKYPILMSGVLAATQPTEFLSIYDHPTAWRGLDREAIFSMRRNLYRFLIPTDARSLIPRHAIETLRTIALSVSPVVLGVEASTLPPRRLYSLGGQLPTSPSIVVKSIEILSNPEISRVAQKITEKDIPASESIVQLFEYDYALDQISRLVAIGLLGKMGNRRLVPMKNAYRVAIDAFIDNTILNLSDRPTASGLRLHRADLFGDSFVVVSRPGEPRVDYLHVEMKPDGISKGYSFESSQHNTSDAKTALYAAHARYPAYKDLQEDKENSHMFIFHLTKDLRNNNLGPWLPRAGVQKALCNEPVLLDQVGNMNTILESILYPNIDFWAENTPLLQRLGAKTESELERIVTK
ncbi:MAG: hypothetical protein ACXAEF_14805 [Candidatus Thorarchaeota archaeon]|jgi:hypothetical protein